MSPAAAPSAVALARRNRSATRCERPRNRGRSSALSQAGKILHELLMSSIDLFGREVMPEVKERDRKRARQKSEQVERLNEKLLKRKVMPQTPTTPTVVRAAGHH